jgi:4-aminobutyrate aminotransferase-like enzyme
MGKRLIDKLTKLYDYPSIGDIRGKGLFVGIEFVKSKETKEPFKAEDHYGEKVADKAFEKGLIIYHGSGFVDGVAGDHIMFGPPLVVTSSQIDEIVRVFDDSLREVENT